MPTSSSNSVKIIKSARATSHTNKDTSITRQDSDPVAHHEAPNTRPLHHPIVSHHYGPWYSPPSPSHPCPPSLSNNPPVPAELGNNPGAIAEYNRIIGLAEAARASKGNETDLLDKRGCGLDPCCPDGSLTCVDDFCSFGDGLNFFGCLLGMFSLLSVCLRWGVLFWEGKLICEGW